MGERNGCGIENERVACSSSTFNWLGLTVGPVTGYSWEMGMAQNLLYPGRMWCLGLSDQNLHEIASKNGKFDGTNEVLNHQIWGTHLI